MKKAILLLLTFSLSFIVNAQTVDEYVEYIQEQGKDPKEYIFEKFKEVDVIILGERSHRDTTQYDLIMDILKDPRFAEYIGYVYTEVGVTNMTEAANRLIKGEYADDEAFYSSFIKFYRNLDYETLWEKYSAYKFIKGLYTINRTLPSDKKITWGLTDRPWNWAEATYESGEYNYYRVYQHRDKYMADNFLKLYHQQPLKNGRRKALIITNTLHAIKIKKGRRTSEVFSETTQGYHIANRLGEKNVEIILFNFFYPEYFNVNYSLPFANCTWDAAFELTDCQPVAISFHHSPFGKCKEKILGKRWDKLVDGLIYYVPFYKHKYMIGIPGLIGDDFFKEYQRRDSITQNHSRPLDKNNIKNWFNTTREIPQGKFEEIQKQQMNEVIKTSRRGRRNHVNGQP